MVLSLTATFGLAMLLWCFASKATVSRLLTQEETLSLAERYFCAARAFIALYWTYLLVAFADVAILGIILFPGICWSRSQRRESAD